jgi:hypothetical protein
MRRALVLVLLLSGPRSTHAQAGPLWGDLRPGPHAVGFRASWQLDRART